METTDNKLSILTIGQIAYYDSQECFVNHLADKQDIDLAFIGAGPASEPLVNYVQEHDIKNVTFGGRYAKKDEMDIVQPYHMINIWLKHDINADSCMANRFYLSAQLRKPMIVSKGSFQGDLCEKYGLGVVLDENDDFSEKIMEWWRSFDAEKYDEGCRAFLRSVDNDMNIFENQLIELIND